MAPTNSKRPQAMMERSSRNPSGRAPGAQSFSVEGCMDSWWEGGLVKACSQGDEKF